MTLQTNYADTLLPGVVPSIKCDLWTPDGDDLPRNKARLHAAARACKVSDERRILMLVMAMMETDHLSEGERDTKKDDCIDGSANASIFNLNEALFRKVGYTGDIKKLNPLSKLPEMVRWINTGIDMLGIRNFLDFTRGGETALKNHTSYGADLYRHGVASALRKIDQFPEVISDGQRTVMIIPYVTNYTPCKKKA